MSQTKQTSPLRAKTWFYGIKQLAEELSVTRSYLSRVLHGRAKASPELLRQLAERGIEPKRLARRMS